MFCSILIKVLHGKRRVTFICIYLIAYLAVEPFSDVHLARNVLKTLMRKDIVMTLSPSDTHPKKNFIFQKGVPSDKFVLILQGKKYTMSSIFVTSSMNWVVLTTFLLRFSPSTLFSQRSSFVHSPLTLFYRDIVLRTDCAVSCFTVTRLYLQLSTRHILLQHMSIVIHTTAWGCLFEICPRCYVLKCIISVFKHALFSRAYISRIWLLPRCLHYIWTVS